MDGRAWKAAVHGVAESWTRLSNFTFSFHFHALEKEMATHSSVLAWRISGTAEPGGLPSMGSHRVGHNWSDFAAAAAAAAGLTLFFPLLPKPLQRTGYCSHGAKSAWQGDTFKNQYISCSWTRPEQVDFFSQKERVLQKVKMAENMAFLAVEW